ncbi:MAG: hypothetical protein FRX49_02110 [Trebouxia sp. A1-2]|nr:MAG: hypothetical protein FRX49_02110 [Trebouxia sp. A1-2]
MPVVKVIVGTMIARDRSRLENVPDGYIRRLLSDMKQLSPIRAGPGSDIGPMQIYTGCAAIGMGQTELQTPRRAGAGSAHPPSWQAAPLGSALVPSSKDLCMQIGISQPKHSQAMVTKF